MAMTPSEAGRTKRPTAEPEEIETLLPWHAAGTLSNRDRLRVEEALRDDPGLAIKADLVREELAETIHLNEMLGSPPPHVAHRLLAAIDAESRVAQRRAPSAAVNWLTGFMASLSPRTLAAAASFAVLAIGVQSVLLVTVSSRTQVAEPQTAQAPAPVFRGLGSEPNGTYTRVRFAREANAGEITNFLQSYQAALVGGPTAAGVYRVRVGTAQMAKTELTRLLQRMRQDRVIELAEADE
jgi:hypothetical protein